MNSKKQNEGKIIAETTATMDLNYYELYLLRSTCSLALQELHKLIRDDDVSEARKKESVALSHALDALLIRISNAMDPLCQNPTIKKFAKKLTEKDIALFQQMVQEYIEQFQEGHSDAGKE